MERGIEQKTEIVIYNMFMRGMSVGDAAAIVEEDVKKVTRLYEKWK